MEKQKIEDNRVSLMRLAMGAIEERIDSEMPKIIDNILDLNTRSDRKRSITITVDFLPNAERNHITMHAVVKSKTEPTNPIQTSLALGVDRKTGELIAVELVPSIPGQLDMNGNEQEQPAQLKLVR